MFRDGSPGGLPCCYCRDNVECGFMGLCFDHYQYVLKQKKIIVPILNESFKPFSLEEIELLSQHEDCKVAQRKKSDIETERLREENKILNRIKKRILSYQNPTSKKTEI